MTVKNENLLDLESPVRVAFLGGGVNSAVGGAHRAALALDGNFDLVAGCFSEDLDINRESADRYGIDAAGRHETLESLLEDGQSRFDAIIVLTPTPLHYEHSMSCIAAGIPVVCEKAVGATSGEVAEIRDRLKASEGFLAPIYNYTGYPMLRELKDMIARGSLGRIQQIHVEMPQEGFARMSPDGRAPAPQAWRSMDGEVPTLSLDLGVHLHHLVHFLSGERPARAVGVENRFGAVEGVVDNVLGLVEYTGDIICNMWYGKTALGQRNGLRVRVCGDGGSAEWVQTDPESLAYNDSRGGRHLIDRSSAETHVACQERYDRFKVGHPAGFIEAFANYYQDIASCLLAHQDRKPVTNPYVSSIETVLEGMRLLEALSVSARQAEWIEIKA